MLSGGTQHHMPSTARRLLITLRYDQEVSLKTSNQKYKYILLFTLAARSFVALVGLAAIEDLPLMSMLSFTNRTLSGDGGRVSSSSDSDSAARASGRSTTIPASPAWNRKE